MTNEIKLFAQEESSYIVSIDFFVSTVEGFLYSITPRELKWTLYDENRRLINSRREIPVEPHENITIILFGNDLKLEGDYPEKRVLTIYGKYDSLFGTDLPILEEIQFQIENHVE